MAISSSESDSASLRLELNGIDVDCVIGERADERERLQRLRVDVVLEIPAAAAYSDELADTVDYAALAERIRHGLVEAECRMIERAAFVVAKLCATEKEVRRVEVRVTKYGAVRHLESASAFFVIDNP